MSYGRDWVKDKTAAAVFIRYDIRSVMHYFRVHVLDVYDTSI